MKKLSALFVVALIVGCLFVCVYPKTYHDSPANSGITAERNDDPGPGPSTYASVDPAHNPVRYLQKLGRALRTDPMVLAEFLHYVEELGGRDEAAVDSSARLFMEDRKLREKALVRASDILFAEYIIPSDEKTFESKVADLRSSVPLWSTDFASYEEYKQYTERQGRLYGITSAESTE